MTSDEILFDAEERMEKALGVFRDDAAISYMHGRLGDSIHVH